MSKKNIWIDCDPGIDDAIALAAAAASRDALNIHGISTVAGNQTIERVTNNALALSAFLDLDVPVVKGAEGPLTRQKKMRDTSTVRQDSAILYCRKLRSRLSRAIHCSLSEIIL